MGRFNDEDDFQFEGRIEHSTAKAWLVDPTVGSQVWVPKSQCRSKTEVDEGLFVFVVSDWWYRKNKESFE